MAVQVESRYWSPLFLLAVSLLFCGSAAYAKANFRLKPGARGALCVDCHDEFQEILRKPFVHTPLAKEDCSGCHDPHTSDHGMLLAADPSAICYECHDDIAPPGARSVHQVALEGRCISCHDPHAAANEMILIRKGSDLCFECHEELGEKIATSDFQHEPVTKDCLECHDPHSSPDNPKLLKDQDPSLCIECHATRKSTFKRAHENYPVEKGRCTFCHDPHGSNTEAILFDNVHDPVSDKECDECHVDPTSASPFALKESGREICEGCHYETVIEALNNRRMHWPLADQKACVNCHAPHASAESGLLKEPMLLLCGRCHSDTIARQERSQTEHPPVADGECAECHSPHGSDNLLLMNEASYLEVCGACHEWQTHSTHPIGEEVIDPRNRNLTVQCATCHRAHGTEYNHFIYFDTTNELCVQCHTEYRR